MKNGLTDNDILMGITWIVVIILMVILWIVLE